jgi:hypothetical protein
MPKREHAATTTAARSARWVAALSRIIWKCWRSRTPYDSARHTGLQQHITVNIPSQSCPRPDFPATQRMAANTSSQPQIHPRLDTGRLLRRFEDPERNARRVLAGNPDGWKRGLGRAAGFV